MKVLIKDGKFETRGVVTEDQYNENVSVKILSGIVSFQEEKLKIHPEWIERYKQSWENDPCFDLIPMDVEDTCFSDFATELSAFHDEMLTMWVRKSKEDLLEKSNKLGLTIPDVQSLECFESRRKFQAENAKRTLEFYFRAAGGSHDNDNVLEIHEIVDNIIDAAVAGAQAELLRQKGFKKEVI